jgi:hypothetical protein
MKIDIFYVNCNPLRVSGPFIIQSLLIIQQQHLSGIFREWMYRRQTRNIWLVLFQTANHDVYTGVLQCTCDGTRHRCPQVAGNRKVVPPAWQCVATDITIWQRIFVNTSNCRIATCAIFSKFVTSRFFLIPMTNEHWKATTTLTNGHSDGRDKTALQHSSKCFAGLLQRPREMLEAVYWRRRKLFQTIHLAPECKYTAFILILSISKLSRHSFHTNTVLSTDINIHSNVAYTNKVCTEYPRIKINNSKCKMSNILKKLKDTNKMYFLLIFTQFFLSHLCIWYLVLIPILYNS